jgi:hypothetical protein
MKKAAFSNGQVKSRLITIDEKTGQLLKSYGFGNLSAGIRRASQLIEKLQRIESCKI